MKAIKYIVITIIIVSVIMFLCVTDLVLVFDQLKDVGIGFGVVLIVSSLSLLLGSMAWRCCFENPKSVSLGKLIYVRTIGETIAFVNPTSIIVGEATKLHLLSDLNIKTREKTDSIFISRILLIVSQLSLALICFLWIGYLNDAFIQIVMFIGVFYVFCFILYKMYDGYFQNRWRESGNRIIRHIFYAKIQCQRFFQRFRIFFNSKRKQIITAYLISCGHWFVGALELLVILNLLGIDSSIFDTLSVDMGVTLLKSAISFVPGQIGIEELGHKWMLSLIAIKSVGTWVSVSVIRRARQLFWIALSLSAYTLFNKI